MTHLNTSNWRILVDLPHKYPALGFNEQAQALERIIINSQPQFAIGIFGAWGSGKTTLMNALNRRLAEKQAIVADFCAWRYEREPHVLVPLLDTLRLSMEEWIERHGEKQPKTTKDKIKDTANIIGRVATALVAGTTTKIAFAGFDLTVDGSKALAKAKELGEDLEAASKGPLEASLLLPDGPRSLYHHTFMVLKAAFAEIIKLAPHLRFVVFVDDLDRCLPKSMVESLEAIKLFFDLQGFVFVVGIDREIVQNAIEARYENTKPDPAHPRGVEYLKKIFQVPFNLPLIRRPQLNELIDSFEPDTDLPPSQLALIKGMVRDHLRYAISALTINPRAVKRYINDFSIQMMVKPDLSPGAVLTLLTLDTRSEWRPVYEALLSEEVGFYDHLRQFTKEKVREQDADPEYPLITPELQAYLSTGPGQALTSIDDISVYLSSSAVISSDEHGWNELNQELARKVARFRSAVRSAVEASESLLREKLLDAVGMSNDLLPLPQYPGSGDLTERIRAFNDSLTGEITMDRSRASLNEAKDLGIRLRQFVSMTKRSF